MANQNKSRYDNTPTAKARKMLLKGKSRPEIQKVTGLTTQSIRAIASNMRKAGIDVKKHNRKFEWVGENDIGQVVRFTSLMDAQRNGFNYNHISRCVNGGKKSYLGYRWSKRAL